MPHLDKYLAQRISFGYTLQKSNNVYSKITIQRSNIMEVLVPIILFGTGIIIATMLSSLGIERLKEAEKNNN